jgi:hypothetical protein
MRPPQGTEIAHQQRSALTLWHDRVWVAYGGLYGDCADYHGSVVSVSTSGASPASYALPVRREGGIWAPGGGMVLGERLFYAAGNGESTGRGYDGSDAVLALNPESRRVDFFAPMTWPQDNAQDLDLGSSSPVAIDGRLLIAGKRGIGYTVAPDHLGGIGGQLTQTPLCSSFGGAAVHESIAYLPCQDSTLAVRLAAGGVPEIVWRSPVNAGSPVLGGGAVWVVDYDAGVLHALDPATGRDKTTIDIGKAPHFASPTLSGARAFVGVLDGVIAISAS